MLLILHLLCLLAPIQSSPSITSQAPDNVFLQGEAIRFQLSGYPTLPTAYTLTDYSGKTVKSGTTGADLNLGRLPVGYYRLTVGTGGEAVTEPVAVVSQPKPGYHGPIATDTASAWLVKPDQFDATAALLQRAGFGWVRERLSWSEVEPQRGHFVWGKYDQCIDAEVAHGLHAYDIFHAIPAWARADHATNRFPDDLRDAYQFTRRLAQHYSGKVHVWEVWNEADGGFSVDLADQYAAFLKACYLGFKAGDPHVRVTQVSMAMPAGRYEEDLYRNDTEAYFDIFNYHIYADPLDYPARAEGHFSLLRRFGIGGKPVWVTEAGIPLHEVKGGLPWDEQKQQADFIPKAYAMSLASGVTKHFFFVFPHYIEPGVEWGVLTPDLLPYPGYCALAASVHLLSQARYMGRILIDGDPKVFAEAFDNGPSATIVIWRNGQDRPVKLPAKLAQSRVFNAVGSTMHPINPSSLTLLLGQAPLFLVVPLQTAERFAQNINPISPPRKQTTRPPALPDIVLRIVMPNSTINKGRETYEIAAGQSVSVRVQVYNFSKKYFSGHVIFRMPNGWSIHLPNNTISIAPMGLVNLSGSLTAPSTGSIQRVRMICVASISNHPNMTSSPANLYLALRLASVKPSAIRPLHLNQESDWINNISGNGMMTIASASSGAVRFNFQFNTPGDRWAYPKTYFNPPADFSHYEAIRFEYRTSVAGTETRVRLMIGKQNGSAYYTESGFPATTQWAWAAIPIRTLTWGSFSPSDPAGGLHGGHHVASLAIGCNTKRNMLTLWIRHAQLVRY
ncbi:MAG: hypothetical protein M1330_02980 [Armatimonadetes bacterium]|nr:hypothetical protein [Armatimonadota bacterium]